MSQDGKQGSKPVQGKQNQTSGSDQSSKSPEPQKKLFPKQSIGIPSPNSNLNKPAQGKPNTTGKTSSGHQIPPISKNTAQDSDKQKTSSGYQLSNPQNPQNKPQGSKLGTGDQEEKKQDSRQTSKKPINTKDNKLSFYYQPLQYGDQTNAAKNNDRLPKTNPPVPSSNTTTKVYKDQCQIEPLKSTLEKWTPEKIKKYIEDPQSDKKKIHWCHMLPKEHEQFFHAGRYNVDQKEYGKSLHEELHHALTYSKPTGWDKEWTEFINEERRQSDGDESEDWAENIPGLHDLIRDQLADMLKRYGIKDYPSATSDYVYGDKRSKKAEQTKGYKDEQYQLGGGLPPKK
jgi:hypothetical protein